MYPFLSGLAELLVKQGFALIFRYKSVSLSLLPSVKHLTFLYTKPTKVTKKFVAHPLYAVILHIIRGTGSMTRRFAAAGGTFLIRIERATG